MKDIYLNEILNEYDEVRRNEARALHSRREKVLGVIPSLGEIQNKIVSLMAESSRQAILNPDKVTSTNKNLQNQIKILKAKEMELLIENGYPKDYLDMHYHCLKCQDTGYAGHLLKEKCPCLTQKLLERAYKLSNIKELDKENFTAFNPKVFPEIPLKGRKLNQREYMLQVRDLLLDYVTAFPDNKKRAILFSGKTGLGKTFLLNSMAKYIIDEGYTVIRVSAYKLFDQLFYSSFSKDSDMEGLYNQLFKVDALIIDDLGTETRRNNYTSEDLFNIINERSLKNGHTFISTNLGLSELRQRYSDRIASRLFDTLNTMVIPFEGQDIRLKKTRQG